MYIIIQITLQLDFLGEFSVTFWTVKSLSSVTVLQYSMSMGWHHMFIVCEYSVYST